MPDSPTTLAYLLRDARIALDVAAERLHRAEQSAAAAPQSPRRAYRLALRRGAYRRARHDMSDARRAAQTSAAPGVRRMLAETA